MDTSAMKKAAKFCGFSTTREYRKWLRSLRTVFTYKCTNCRAKNDTQFPPPDNMVHCSKCGYLTVQVFHKVTHKKPRKPSTGE